MKNTLNKIAVVDPKDVPFWVHMFDLDPCWISALRFCEWPKDLYMYYLPDKDGKTKDLFIYWSDVDLYDEIYGSCNT